jgi:hypothetical protein
MNEYLWDRVVKKSAPDRWGPELKDKINSVISICKWPDQFEPKTHKDPKLAAEFSWWRDWLDQYLTGSLDARSAVLRAIAHLEEDPETKKEMDKSRAEERDLADLLRNERSFAEGVRRALEKLHGKGIVEPCPSPHGEAKLDPKTKAEVDKLVREEYTKEKLPGYVEMASGRSHGAPPVVIQRPETGEAQPLRPNPLVNLMRHAFRFRKARPMYANRLLRSGTMDEDQLWRTLDNDLRVFEQRVIEEDPETQVTLLVDASGSMSGHKIELATTLAAVLLECLKDMKGVRVRVRAHTSENRSDYTDDGPFSGWSSPTVPKGGVLHIYRIWEPGDETRRINLMPRLEMTANYDGFAIAWCAEEMIRESRPGEDMVMIVLADGLPAGGAGFYYHGGEAVQHVRQVVDEYKRKNVHIIQLAIDTAVGADAQRKMFGDSFIPYKDDASLPRQMTEFLIRLFGNNQ